MHFNDLKSLFVVEDPHAPHTEEAPAPPTAKAKTTLSGIPGIPGIPVSQPSAPTVSAVGVIDPTQANTFTEKLRGKFLTSPFASIIEQLRTTVEGLSEDIPSEGNRYRAAFKLLKSQAGVDIAKLTEAYKSLIGILDAEATKFGKALEAQKATEVDSRESQVNSINAQIEQKNNEIGQLMNQRDEIATAIVDQKTKLGAAQASFEGAQTTLRSEINDQLTKLTIYDPAAHPATTVTK